MLTDTTWYTRLLASVGVLLSVVGGCANLLLLYVLLSRRLPPWQDKHTTKRRLSPLEVHLLNITVLETLVALVLIPLVIISTLVTVGWGVKVDKDVVMGHVVSAEYKAMKQWTMIVCHLPIGMRILTDMVRCLLLEAFSVERYVVVTMGVFPHQWIVRLGMAVAWVLGAVLMVSQVSHGDTLMTIHLCHHTYSDLKDIQDKEAVGKICSILRLVVVLQVNYNIPY
nr:hypothetical protein BaRGS_026135 [Batillaria attramentaria]